MGGHWVITIALKELILKLQLSTSAIAYGDGVLRRAQNIFG